MLASLGGGRHPLAATSIQLAASNCRPSTTVQTCRRQQSTQGRKPLAYMVRLPPLPCIQVPCSFVPVPNPDEVQAVFSMPLSCFLDAQRHLHWDVRSKSNP